MSVQVLNQRAVERLLTMPACIDVMRDTLQALARGEAILPLRQIMWLPERVGALGSMPSYLASIHAIGIKVVSVFPGNHGTKYDSHQGVVLVFEATHGVLLAMVDATSITSIRTAAASAVATHALARPEAATLALLGSGVQARSHLAAMRAVRPIASVRVWSRNHERASAFAEAMRELHALPVIASSSAEVAVRDADIICTTTSSSEPVLHGAWITPGTHVNAVGSSVAFARELDAHAMRNARLFVDRRESTINESGDYLLAQREGAIGESHIVGEVGDVLIGRVRGRESSSEITIFKSLGLAVEDLAAAYYVYRESLQQQIGQSVEIGGLRPTDSGDA